LFKGQRPLVGEGGKEFAERLLNEKFGKGNYETGPKSDYNVLKKFGDRGFMDPPSTNGGSGHFYTGPDGTIRCGDCYEEF
jgi:hypothetical protein